MRIINFTKLLLAVPLLWLCLCLPGLQSAYAQSNLTGTVTDSEGNTLPGVSIQIKGTTSGTITDMDGKFSLAVENGRTLIFTYVGYTPQEIVVGNQRVLRVKMETDAKKLSEVVVVGFGTQKKESVTGAIASVETKELLQSPVANISNSLVGRMPGLFAVQGSGEPGNDQSQIRIRGVSTFAGGASAQPLIMVDGIQVDNWNNIDPNEIDRVTILKDASSTAVYGVRGANGVILITTKRGLVGKPQLSLTTNVGSSSFTGLRKQMSSYDYARLTNDGLRNDGFISGGYIPRYTEEELEKYRSGVDPVFYPNTDWYDLLFKDRALQTQHNLQVSGGTDKVKYLVSGGFFTQEGLFKNTANIEEYDANRVFKRYNFRSNFDFTITSRLKAKIDISSQTEQSSGSNTATPTIVAGAGRANPITSPGLIDGKIANIANRGITTHPIGLLFDNGYRRSFRNYLQGSVSLNHDLDFITKGLRVYGMANYQNNNEETLVNRRNGGFVSYQAYPLPDGGVNLVPQGVVQPFGYSQIIDKRRRTYAEVGINYEREFGKHFVATMFNYNQTKLHDPNLAFLVPNGLQGVVNRTNYEYGGRYLFQFVFGYNGTENFAEGKRFGFFPAASVGWVVSEEPFFPKNDYVNLFKIRGSYGVDGNDRIGGSRFLYLPSAYTQANAGYNFGEVGSNFNAQRYAIEQRMGNPDLTWERSFKKNVGLELSLLKNKLYVTTDFFRDDRENILISLNTVPALAGATLPAFNLGKMKNQGMEVEVNFNDKIGSVGYFVRGNYTYAANEIVFMDEVNRPYEYQRRSGQRFGQIFGLMADGLYNTWEEVNAANRPESIWNSDKIQPGDVRYVDTNGDGKIDFDDQVPIGYSNFPEKVFGFSFGANYKGFDFSALFQGVSNVSFEYHRRQINGFFENSGAVDYLVNSWSQERFDQGLPIDFPRVSENGMVYNHNYQTSTYWLADGSYLRFKNLEVGYNLSPDLLKRVGMRSARIYVNGNNLLTWSKLLPGIDPENTTINANDEPYPLVRTVNMGLNVKF